MKNKKVPISRIGNWLVLASLIWVIFNTGLYKMPRKVIYWDVLEYYSYLPATFIHKDLSLKFTEKDPARYSDEFWPLSTPNGGRITKMSMGMALLYSPFFFAGHAVALVSGARADGFSAPYKLALQLSCIFYLAIGLYFLRRILRRYFSETVTLISLLAVTLGTNLYYYASIEAPMSHVYSFSLFALFVHLTIRWYEKPGVKYSVFLGALGGLITLVRPTNILVFLFFGFWGLKHWEDIPARIRFWTSRWGMFCVMILCFFVVWIPQLVYWKYNTGQWFYYSYGNQHFFFGDPQILNGLFSYRKGWLLYTPIMSLSVLGFFFLYKTLREFFWPVLIFSLINFYVIVSWWCWWYGGGFGLRPMIDSYSLLLFPMAAFVKFILSRRIIPKIAGLLLIAVLILHSLFESAQYVYGSIHWDSMTKAAYWNSFGRLRPSSEFPSLIKTPDYDKALRGDRDE